MKLAEGKNHHNSSTSDNREDIGVFNGAYYGAVINTVENLSTIFGSSKNTLLIKRILYNENWNVSPKVRKTENKRRGSE